MHDRDRQVLGCDIVRGTNRELFVPNYAPLLCLWANTVNLIFTGHGIPLQDSSASIRMIVYVLVSREWDLTACLRIDVAVSMHDRTAARAVHLESAATDGAGPVKQETY